MIKNTIGVLVSTPQGPQYVDKESALYDSIIDIIKDKKGIRNVLIACNDDSQGCLLYNVPLIPIHIN